MFLREKIHKKDGKEDRCFSVVENRRVAAGRVVQRHVLYRGEINDSQELAWRALIKDLEDGAAQPRMLSLFPEDRCKGLLSDGDHPREVVATAAAPAAGSKGRQNRESARNRLATSPRRPRLYSRRSPVTVFTPHRITTA
jgi:hypothetical protein